MVTAAPTQTITLTRTIKTTPEEVYRAFTDIDGVRGWLSSSGHLRSAVGGHLFLAWSQEQYYTTCEYTALEENKKVAFRWRGMGENENSQVEVTIEPQGEKVKLTLTHSDLEDGADPGMYQSEWAKRLNNLVTMLETGADLRITERVIIGIIPGGLTDKETEALGLKEGEGNKVTAALEGFSAAAAGLQAGDIVVEVDGRKIDNNIGIYNIVVDAGKGVGDSVEITYYRDGQKHKADVVLKGYPVPELPESFAALGDRMAEVYARQIRDIEALYADATGGQASSKPAEDEWSANEVVAHLILNARSVQERLGSFMQGSRPASYTANTPARIAGITKTFVTKDAIVGELKRAFDETVAILKNMPEEFTKRPLNLWHMSFDLNQDTWHTDTHISQIREALATAKG